MTPLKYLLAILLVVCLTILTFTFINRGRLCELNIKNDRQEVAAKLACTSGYLNGRGHPPELPELCP